jgi:hypothetical protein
MVQKIEGVSFPGNDNGRMMVKSRTMSIFYLQETLLPYSLNQNIENVVEKTFTNTRL